MAEYSVAAAVQGQPLFPSGTQDNKISSVVLRSVLDNSNIDTSVRHTISSVIADTYTHHLNSFKSSAEKYFQYGKNYHPDGIPTDRTAGRDAADAVEDEGSVEAIQAIIEAEIGEEIIIEYYAYRPTKPNLVAIKWLLDDVKLTVTNTRASTYTTHGIFDFYKIASGSRQRVIAPPTIVGNTLTISHSTIIEYRDYSECQDAQTDDGQRECQQDYDTYWDFADVSVVQTRVYDLSLTSSYTDISILHQVRYFLKSNHRVFIWMYNQNDNTYPDIHTNLVGFSEDGCFPFAVLIDSGKKVSEDELGVDYKRHTDYLLNKLGIELDTVMEGLEDPDDSTSLSSVEDAFIMFGVDFDTSEQESLMYLYEFFRNAHYHENAFSQSDWITHGPTFYAGNTTHYSSSKISFRIGHTFTTVEELNGAITSTTVPNLQVVIVDGAELDPNNDGVTYVQDGDVTETLLGEISSQIVLGDFSSYDRYGLGYNNHTLILRKQHTPTTYIQIVIHGLDYFTRVLDTETRKSKGVLATLNDLSNRRFLLPISHNVINNLHPIIQAYILEQGLHISIYSITVTKLKWYQTSTFATIMLVVRIVLLAVSLGSSEGIWEAIWFLIQNYVIGQIIVYGLAILVDAIGGEAALFLAAVAAVASITLGDGSGTFALMSADQLMQAAGYLITATNVVTADAFEDLRREMAVAEDLLESQEEQIAKINDLLDDGGGELNYLDLIVNRPVLDLNESPTAYYNRSIHITNPGVLSLDNIDSYIGNLLRLPELSEYNTSIRGLT